MGWPAIAPDAGNVVTVIDAITCAGFAAYFAQYLLAVGGSEALRLRVSSAMEPELRRASELLRRAQTLHTHAPGSQEEVDCAAAMWSGVDALGQLSRDRDAVLRGFTMASWGLGVAVTLAAVATLLWVIGGDALPWVNVVGLLWLVACVGFGVPAVPWLRWIHRWYGHPRATAEPQKTSTPAPPQITAPPAVPTVSPDEAARAEPATAGAKHG